MPILAGISVFPVSLIYNRIHGMTVVAPTAESPGIVLAIERSAAIVHLQSIVVQILL